MSQSDFDNQESSGEQTTLTESTLPSRKKENLTSAEWDRICEKRKELDSYSCANCDNAERQLSVHHVVPDTNGGTVRMGNLRSLCSQCHDKSHIHDAIPAPTTANSVKAPYIPMTRTLRDIISEVGHPLHKAIWMLLSKTGIRVDELVDLDMDQLSLRRNPIGYSGIGPRKPREIDHITVYEKNTEGVPGARGSRLVDVRIPLDRELAKVLREWFTIRPDPRPSLDGNPVFLTTTRNYGGGLSGNMIHHAVARHARERGHYKEGAGQRHNITPITLSHFFDERYSGQPSVRDYILGKRDDMPFPFHRLATDYREGVPSLLE